MWPNPQETSYLVTFTEETLNGKLHFLCSDKMLNKKYDYLLYYRNFKRYINQRKFGSFNVYLARANKCIELTFFALISTHVRK